MASKKGIYILPSNFVIIWICSVCQSVFKPAQTFTSKKKYKKFAFVAYILQNMQNLVIAEDGKEMYKD